jgi:hypothetical protein
LHASQVFQGLELDFLQRDSTNRGLGADLHSKNQWLVEILIRKAGVLQDAPSALLEARGQGEVNLED